MNGGLAGIQSDLDQAAQIAGRYDVCTSTVDVLRLSHAELASELRLQHVVGPGGATAEVALGHVNNMEPRIAQELARLLGNALRVLEGARIMVGDPYRTALRRLLEPDLLDQF